MNEIISAIIILFSKEGTSMEDSASLITSKNIEKYVPPYSSMKKAEDYFRSKGFKVTGGDINLSITGEKELFNKTFKTDIKISKHPQTGDNIVSSERKLAVPKELRQEVSKIVFPETPEFY